MLGSTAASSLLTVLKTYPCLSLSCEILRLLQLKCAILRRCISSLAFVCSMRPLTGRSEVRAHFSHKRSASSRLQCSASQSLFVFAVKPCASTPILSFRFMIAVKVLFVMLYLITTTVLFMPNYTSSISASFSCRQCVLYLPCFDIGYTTRTYEESESCTL